MNRNEDDTDWLNMILTEQDDYIDDAGFTDDIMQKLPPARKNLSPWVEPSILLCAFCASLGVLIWMIPGFDNLYSQFVNSLRNTSIFASFGIISALAIFLSALSYIIGTSES